MRDFWEGADMCFDNSPYLGSDDKYAAPDFPFVVDNNCYETNFWDCHTQGYKLKVHVLDHELANTVNNTQNDQIAVEDGPQWPMRLPKMYVKVAFQGIFDYF
jgi:hypothetical protein